jgi:hypothetical protein
MEFNSARTDNHKLNKYIMLVSSPRPNHSIPGVPDKVGNLCYKVLLYPDALRHAKTPKCGRYINTRYTNEITTLCIIYHQKGLDEEILNHQTKLCKMYSILRYCTISFNSAVTRHVAFKIAEM